MSIEAMKLAAEFNRYFTSANGVDVRAKVSVTRDEWRVLFNAIQQAEAQQPATGEPVAWSEREQLRHAQAAVVMPMIGPLLDAWENSDREVMSQEPELSKQLKNINSAMEDADTHQAPSVPAGYVLAPIEPTDEMMSEMLGPFIAINGDNRSAFIEAYPRMLTAAMLAAKEAK